MSKKAEEAVEQKESLRTRILNFLKGDKKTSESVAETTAETVADDDDEDAATAEDDDEEMSAETTADSDNDDDTEDEEENDPDDDDDSDEDDIEVNGEKVNLKDPAAARAAIEGLQATIATQNGLLTEAANELAKTNKQVREEIKSTFKVPSSKRSQQMGVDTSEPELPEGVLPKEGTAAYNAMKRATSKMKSLNKK